jgi:hypothetical protein
MRARVATFWTPKAGHTAAEYEDAAWPGPLGDGEREGNRLRLALCDGATESLLAGRWARQLAATFGGASGDSFAPLLTAATSRFEDELRGYLADRRARGRPIQWYEEPGLRRGARATLLVTEFEEPDGDAGGNWEALAVGDSCLFQVRRDRLRVAFPLEQVESFGCVPDLVSSRGRDVGAARTRLLQGRWRPGDVFYLATDALAAWFLRVVDDGGRPWEELDALAPGDGPAFAGWVGRLRMTRAMKNDDVTLVRVEVR